MTPLDPPARDRPHEIRVAIADDYEIVRDGLRALIDAQPDMHVISESADGEEAWRLACELRPDVLVLDLSMPRVSGADAAEMIARDCPGVKIVALTMHEERGYATRLLRAGAAGYVLKRAASSDLVRAIRSVAAGERYVDPSLAGALLADTHHASRAESGANEPVRAPSLTPRESDVLRLLALGYSNKEIAAALSISVKTVETHRASGMARLGVTTRAALVRFALAEGWLRGR